MTIANNKLSKEPDDMLNTEAKLAPPNDPIVDPKLFIDIKRANNVPSIPGGHNCPDRIRNGMNLQIMKSYHHISNVYWCLTNFSCATNVIGGIFIARHVKYISVR